jgi:hypothetical protein
MPQQLQFILQFSPCTVSLAGGYAIGGEVSAVGRVEELVEQEGMGWFRWVDLSRGRQRQQQWSAEFHGGCCMSMARELPVHIDSSDVWGAVGLWQCWLWTKLAGGKILGSPGVLSV